LPKHAQEKSFARKSVRYMRAKFFLAKEMGKSVGRGEVLQRQMPDE
jgi:hypothetical protein